MAYTAANVIAVAREYLKDDVAPYRWTDANFFVDLSEALLELKDRRADLLIGSDRTLTTVATITATTDAMPFPDRFKNRLASYLAHLRYLTENSDVSNLQMATYHKQRWEEAIATL